MAKNITTFLKLHKVSLLLVFCSLLLYYSFAYHLLRTDFIKLITLFTALFIFCFKLIQFEKWNGKFLMAAGLLFRLVFVLAEPNLSQDYYRFIWDGELVSHLVNPYLEIPNILIEQQNLIIANAQELYNGMGSLSAKHFSNYPPLNQIIFAISSILGGNSILGAVVVMRLFIIGADIGIVYFGRKLLKHINRSPHLIFWYFLNPLVIIELSGNLHFEGVMLFFFVWAMYLLSDEKWKLAAVIYGCSIAIKLVPLLFLPLFLKYFGLKKSLLFYTFVAVSCIVFLIPFYSPEFGSNYAKTIGLWFSNFEFNAGLYNGIKQVANLYGAKPWELIKTYGKITPMLTILVVLFITFFRKNQRLSVLISSMLFVLTFYFFVSATVHPWYVIFLVMLGILSDFRYPLLWSMAVVLSYSAYSNPQFTENLWLLGIEYTLVFGFLLYEIITQGGKKVLLHKN